MMMAGSCPGVRKCPRRITPLKYSDAGMGRLERAFTTTRT